MKIDLKSALQDVKTLTKDLNNCKLEIQKNYISKSHLRPHVRLNLKQCSIIGLKHPTLLENGSNFQKTM